MRLTISFILSIIFAVGLVAFGFTFYQSSAERTKMNRELELRSAHISEEIFRDKSFFFKNIAGENIENYSDSVVRQFNLIGMAVYFRSDSIFSNYPVKTYIDYSRAYISQSLVADTSIGNFFKVGTKKIFQFIKPIKNDGSYNMAVILYSDAGFIDKVIGSIWFRNFMGWFIQAFLISLVTLLLIRWGILKQINRIVDWAKAVRTGKTPQI